MKNVAISIVVFGGASLCPLQVEAADAPPTADGLERVEGAAALLYVRPGTEWSKYESVQILPLLIRPHVRDAAPAGEKGASRESFVLGDKEVAELQQIFSDAMRAELSKDGFAVADAPGPATLLLAAELTDIVLNAPIEGTRRSYSQPGLTITRGAGSLAIKAVLADGATRAIVAAAADRKYGQDIWNVNTRAGNVAEVRAAFKDWGRRLSAGLKERGVRQR